MPDGTSDLEAAAMRTAYDTAYMALTYRGGFQPGQVVFAPAVGSSVANAVIQLGRILGAERVITTASSSAKARHARGLGYEDVIDLSQESIRDGIAHLTKNAGVDPSHPERMYCSTFGKGLWRSNDYGDTWTPVGAGIRSPEVMAVAVSEASRSGKYGVVWAGTEPSALFHSEDGGESWIEHRSLQAIPSRTALPWSFPPRPYTHHVR